MKKLFTLAVAMMLVSMSFAQGLLINTNTQVQFPANERSDWFGFYATSGAVFVMDGGGEYCLRIPEGSIPAGAAIESVRFYHTTSDHVTGYSGTFNNETYNIRFYTGTTYDAENGNITPGTLAYSFNYTVPDGDDGLGINIASLPAPFTMPASGDVTVSVYAPESAAACLCPVNDECEALNFAMFAGYEDNGYHHYLFGDAETQSYANKPFLLSVYYNDGQAYQPKCDFYAEMYDPQDMQTYPDAVERVKCDQYTDSIYFYGGAFNTGVDDAIGFFTLSIYFDGATPFYIYDHEDMTGETADTVALHYGWRWGAWDLLGTDELEGYGLEYPLSLCVSIGFTSESSYNAIDPDLNNNTYCVEYYYDNGIDEKTNDLMVYPNPACNEIHIDNVAGAQVSIFNIAGQEVMSIENADASATINVANLTEGLYVVRVVNGNEVSTSKVNIVR